MPWRVLVASSSGLMMGVENSHLFLREGNVGYLLWLWWLLPSQQILRCQEGSSPRQTRTGFCKSWWNEDIPQAAEPQKVSDRLVRVPFRHTLETAVVCVCLDTSATRSMNIKLLAYLRYNSVCPLSPCHVTRMIFHALSLLSEPSFWKNCFLLHGWYEYIFMVWIIFQ